jgi:PIN domain nuclease of toxin-antitoxin system
MRLLLDTNILIWALSDPKRLGRRVQNALAGAQNEKWLSPATPFEIAVKINTGKLDILSGFEDFDSMMEEAQSVIGFQLLPINFLHAAALSRLPMYHRDPFDRLMIAQAMTDGLTLVSSDRQFAYYTDLDLMPV